MSTIKPLQILQIEDQEDYFFGIVKSIIKVSVSKEQIRESIRGKSDKIIQMGCYCIEIIIFSTDNGYHKTTLTSKHLDSDRFESINDKDFSYKFYSQYLDACIGPN